MCTPAGDERERTLGRLQIKSNENNENQYEAQKMSANQILNR